MKNDIVWSKIGLGFGEPGGTPPPRLPRGNPRGRRRATSSSLQQTVLLQYRGVKAQPLKGG